MSQREGSPEGASASEKPRSGNDDDDDNRSILVSNVPHTLSDDKVMIHFQRKSSGGGDVRQVRRLSPSQAKVIFEDVKVIHRVVACEHELDGVILQVEAWSSFLVRALEMDRARHREPNQLSVVQIHQPVTRPVWDSFKQKMSKTNLKVTPNRSTRNNLVTFKGIWNDVIEARNLLLCDIESDAKSTLGLDSNKSGSRNGQNKKEEGGTDSLRHLQDATSIAPADESQHQLQPAVNNGTENPSENQPPEMVDVDREQREGASNTRLYDKKEQNSGASSCRSTSQMTKDSQKWDEDEAGFPRSQSSETRENGLKEETEYGTLANFQQSTSAPSGTSSTNRTSSMGEVGPRQERKEKNPDGASSGRSTTHVPKIDESRADNLTAFARSQSSETREENLLREARGNGRNMTSLQRSVSAPDGASSAYESSNTRATGPKQDTTPAPSSPEPSSSRGVPASKHSFGSQTGTSNTAVKAGSTSHSEAASTAEERRNGRPWSQSEGRTRPGGTYNLGEISDDEDDVFNNTKSASKVTVEQPVDADILSYIIKVHKSKIIAITDCHKVTLRLSEEKTVVYFKGLKNNAEDALDDFITLYQGLFSKLKSISLDTNMHDIKSEVCSYAVECVQKSSPAVFIKNTDGIIIFIGDESEVRSARAEICSILKISETRRRKSHSGSVPSPSPSVGSVPGQASATAIWPDPGLGGKMAFKDSIKGVQICVVEGDITQQKVDVIVNAANGSLNLNWGVSGAISKAGGSSIQTECNSIIGRVGYLKTTDCIWTWGGRLPCKFVIHAVGPHYSSSYGAHRSQQELHDTCHKVLRMAASELKAVSIAMPAISSGACGMPRDLCADSMFSAITDFIENASKDNSLVDIHIIDNDRRAAEVFSDVFGKMLKKFNAGKGHMTSPNLQPKYPPFSTYPGAGPTSVSQGTSQTSFGVRVSPSGGQTSPNSNPTYGGQAHQNIPFSSSASSPLYPGPTPTYVNAMSSYPHGNATTPSYPHPAPNYSSGGLSHTYPGARQTQPSQSLLSVGQTRFTSATSQNHSSFTSPGLASASSPVYPGTAHSPSSFGQTRLMTGTAGQNTSPGLASSSSSSPSSGNSDKEDTCPICLCDFTGPVTTTSCKHKFCADCLDSALKVSGQCPVCKSVIGRLKGNQPHGTMTHRIDYLNTLPGYEYCRSTIEIQYYFPSGIQGAEHPNPGKPYTGTSRRAYLPDNVEGNEVLRLLKRAFDSLLVFTIGTSVTTGQTDTVVWNDIHHKTSKYGGPNSYGYPDPQYLTRVKEELAAKGIK